MFNTNKIYDVSKWSLADRFIPRRSASNFDYSYYLINNTHSEDNLGSKRFKTCNWGVTLSAKQQYYKQNYITNIKEVLLPRTEKVLEFCRRPRSIFYTTDDDKMCWPVQARTKPLLSPPAWVLDMPNVDIRAGRHVVDWGRQGIIAAIFEGDVHLWHPTRTLKRQVTNTNGNVKHCIRWNFHGTRLAMAQRGSTISIWDMQKFKTIMSTRCPCLTCSISAMVWTKTNCLLTGCSRGRLCYWSPNLKCIANSMMHNGEIINVKLSAAEDKLVTTGIDKHVNVYKWPSTKSCLEVKYNGPVKALDWHPWKNSVLAVGGDALFTIYNVNMVSILDSKPNPLGTHCDCFTFNPVSGELVVSAFTLDPNPEESFTSLSVLKNLDTVVDQIQYQFGRYAYLLWDSTGTKLAGASSDENLYIWDFFGKSTKLEKKFLGRNNKNHTTNMFKTLDMFDNRIR